ncbi:hypothetical protein [Leptothoe spongobia]|uniref:Uncharacterized protein n=1 Tax=Leptothoe spongobia TAU-MAC 1115 TaxID=1967444 RepID=A0A947DC92_9CYAN|nr:hypothetical protein [Leptothoe spongobia]MBT9314495.1 hypothetical protein [Leptothoe spongobia TAU-MAC 1115]
MVRENHGQELPILVTPFFCHDLDRTGAHLTCCASTLRPPMDVVRAYVLVLQ